MTQTLRLLAGGLTSQLGQPSLADPLTPEALASCHPAWARDVQALGPWRPDETGQFFLPAVPTGDDTVVCGPCGSTMDVARELAARGLLGEWGGVLAPTQSAGRGQLRRPWLSQAGNLFATLRCPEAPARWSELRPLLLGYLLARALDEDSGVIRLKWPNDLLLGERKVGGMLIEERQGCILAGLGLNLAWAPEPEALREDHAISAGIFSPKNPELGPARLWSSLVKQAKTGYGSLLDACTPTDFLAIFQSRLAWSGRRVLVREGAGTAYEARIVGVSEAGGLVLEHHGRRVCLCAGDVTPL